MRVLPLLVIAAAELFAADDPGREFMELVLADMRRPFPTDAELSRRFTEHDKAFEQLVAMAKADKEVIRIAPDFTWTASNLAWPRPESELGFSVERWNEYRHLFQTLGIEGGVLRPWDHRDAVYLIVQGKGLVTGGSVKATHIPTRPLSRAAIPWIILKCVKPEMRQKSALNRSVENGTFTLSKIDVATDWGLTMRWSNRRPTCI